jgi:electron transfer flavoprotein beta subunit
VNIVVCVKPVPDVSIIAVDAGTGYIDDNDLVYIINPCDMAAVEEAVRIKEIDGSGHVTILSVTPRSNKRLLRRCLAIGADEARLIWDNGFDNLDSFATGMLLAGVIRSLPYDLILCGQKAIDTEAGQVGTVIAEKLDIPVALRVAKVDVSPDAKKVTVESKLEKGNRARMEVVLPALLAVESDLNEPRYAGLPSLMAGLRSDIKEYDLKALGLSADEAGPGEARTRTVALSPPKPRPKKVFTPDASLSAAERLRLIMSGGVQQKQSDVLEGAVENIASTVIKFLKEKRFISKKE